MPTELFVLLPLAFVSGLINAAVGGGGLIQVPGLFATLPQALPAAIFGTVKLTAAMGLSSAMRQYARRMKLPWRLLGASAAAAFCGSYLGARAMYLLPATWMRPLVIALLAIMLVYTWLRPSFGELDSGRTPTRRDITLGLLLGMAIGFYDGFFGPGAGSFLIFMFVRFFHFDFLRASACAKVVNVATCLAALVFLIPADAVLYHFAIPMGVVGMLGSVVGARLAMKGGNTWIRRAFVVLALSLLGKLVWETFRV